jgi:A/G-specific adenine glycosylase
MKPKPAAASALEPSPELLRAIRSAVLGHYDAHARDLPWRRTRDPYAIWVSEVMLQQTRVETVLRYYDRFLQRFPDAASLANAEEDAVLAAWSGLGYYRRARLLHSGVREVVAKYGGRVPEAPELRRKLPGIGRYTAGAIGSIAFEREEPLVDGNVARVFSRLFGIDTPLGQRETESRLWAFAERLIAGPRPGAFNQALMELGALTCTKSSPQCTRCPVAQACHAHAYGRAAQLPVVTKKAPPQLRELVALLALDSAHEHILLQRSAEGLFHGLWNLPMRDGHDRSAARALMRTLGLRGTLAKQPSATLEHVLTHRRLRIQLYPVALPALSTVGDALLTRAGPATRLQARARLSELGISSLTQKALATLSKPARPTQLAWVE